MKFVHTGDIHYGMCPDSDKPWAREREQAVKASLASIVATVKTEQAELLLIAGDLFHRQPTLRELKEVNYLCSVIPAVQIVIIAGNHDYIRESSALLSFTWAENVHYITTAELDSIALPKLHTEVYGFSYHQKEITEDLLASLHIPENESIRILLCHGGDARHLPLNPSTLAAAGFSYCALGHIHKPQALCSDRVVWCGSPEPLDLTETGAHGCYVGEIDDSTRQLSSLRFIPLSKLQYISLKIQVTPESTNEELLMNVEEEIRRRGAHNIYRLKIQGMRDPDILFEADRLKDRYRIAELIDESEPRYDFPRLFAEHPSDMIGFFIQELDRPDMSELDRKALYYGVNALLRTTDERSSGT